jgi:hypothetical protein
MVRTISAVLVALAVVAGAGACTAGAPKPAPAGGGTHAAPPAAGYPDSCALVSKEEVSAALGITVTEAKKLDNGLCMFQSANLSDPFLSTDIHDDKATLETFTSYIEGIKDRGAAYEVAGVGDAARYVDLNADGLRLLTLYVLQGHVMFALGNLENLKGQRGQTQPLPAVRTLALQAIARLKR